MSRKNRRKRVRKGKSRLTPEDRVMNALESGEWLTIQEIQERASVQLVVVRRMVGRGNIISKKDHGDLLYSLKN